jgi:hypothetical protein
MGDHKSHQRQLHTHGPGCGHATIDHKEHRDYVLEGRLDCITADRIEAHSLDVSDANPAACTPAHACGGHPADHIHGPDCKHLAIPHGDHVDYVVDGHLHHPCAKHCDDHGPVTVHT